MNETSPHAPHSRPKGVMAAALTPLDDELRPDLEGLVAHYRWLLESGCDAIVAQGTTGEANSFSTAERLAMLDHLAETDLPERLIVGTGLCNVPETVELTRRAIEIGAAGTLVLPPFYYKGVSQDGIYAHFAEVIERVGDARLRFYIYQFPQMTALDIGLPVIERLIKHYPETVVGLKNSSGDWDNIQAMLKAFPGFDVFTGTEELLLESLRLGGPGVMSATVNILAPETAALYAGWQSEAAEDLQARVSALRQSVTRFPAIPALKAVMARISGHPGRWTRVRAPLRPLDAEAQDAVMASLEKAGWAVKQAA
jgi:4-hydroxy-tetrahydrodipicolinate synthase